MKIFALAAILVSLGSVSQAGDPAQQFAGHCINETRAPGSYMIKAKGRIAEVSPVVASGATARGAEAINRCISKRAAATLPGYVREQNRYIPVLVQRSAILKCRRKLGIRGRVRFGARWLEVPQGRHTDLWILPYGSLSAVNADRVNDCADRALNRPRTPRTGADYANLSASRSVGGVCPKHAAFMYGGATYCIGN